jgi:hypothetical protein
MGKHSTNEKDPRVSSTGPSGNHSTALNSTGTNPAQLELNLYPAKRKYSPKSTATEAQYERIDRAFDHVGKLISTLDFRKMGVLHPAGRVREMNKKMGYYIPTVDLRTVIDEQGFPHLRIAFYELIDRPKTGGAAQ